MANSTTRSALALSGIALLSLAAAGCTPAPATEPGKLPDSARTITDKAAYVNARWNFQVADLDTGEVLLAQRPDETVLTGSTGKQFPIGTLYDTVGPDTRLSTPVYATAAPAGGVVHGDLILVAAADLAMGGRGAMAGRVDDAFDAEHIDHVYGDIAPNAARVHDDPLAGLDDPARQIATRGVTAVSGDVVESDRDPGSGEPTHTGGVRVDPRAQTAADCVPGARRGRLGPHPVHRST